MRRNSELGNVTADFGLQQLSDRSLTEHSEASTSRTSVMRDIVAGAMTAVAAAVGPTRKITLRSASPATAQVDESNVRAELMSLTKKLRSIESHDLEFGVRLEIMRAILPPAMAKGENAFFDALYRLIFTSNEYLASETKAAALRYLGVYDSSLKSRDLAKLFVSTIKLGGDQEAVAAARSLAEVGDTGVIPALEQAANETRSESARKAAQAAIREIREAYGTRSSP